MTRQLPRASAAPQGAADEPPREASAGDGPERDRSAPRWQHKAIAFAAWATLALAVLTGAALLIAGPDIVLWCSAKGHARSLRTLLALNRDWANGGPADLTLGGAWPAGAPLSPISAASAGGHFDAAEALLDAGANPMPDDGLVAPLSHAVTRGDKAIAKLMMDHGAWPTGRDVYAASDLDLLRIIAPPGLARRALAAGRGISSAFSSFALPNYGPPPTPYEIERLDVLIEAGHTAWEYYYLVLLGRSLDHAGDETTVSLPDLAKRHGVPPHMNRGMLFVTTSRGIQGMLDLGVDINDAAHGSVGGALVAASRDGSEETALALLDAGADPKGALSADPIWESDGRSALHFAAKRGFDKLARRLVDLGADPNAVDTEGKTPLDLAATPEIADFLEWASKR
jgi:hypothetical protein